MTKYLEFLDQLNRISKLNSIGWTLPKIGLEFRSALDLSQTVQSARALGNPPVSALNAAASAVLRSSSVDSYVKGLFGSKSYLDSLIKAPSIRDFQSLGIGSFLKEMQSLSAVSSGLGLHNHISAIERTYPSLRRPARSSSMFNDSVLRAASASVSRLTLDSVPQLKALTAMVEHLSRPYERSVWASGTLLQGIAGIRLSPADSLLGHAAQSVLQGLTSATQAEAAWYSSIIDGVLEHETALRDDDLDAFIEGISSTVISDFEQQMTAHPNTLPTQQAHRQWLDAIALLIALIQFGFDIHSDRQNQVILDRQTFILERIAVGQEKFIQKLEASHPHVSDIDTTSHEAQLSWVAVKSSPVRATSASDSAIVGRIFPNQSLLEHERKNGRVYVEWFDHIAGMPRLGWVSRQVLVRPFK